MKNFILIVIFALMSIITFGNNVLTDTSIKKVVVEAPCRIIYSVADTTLVRVNNTNANFNMLYEVKDSVLYLKPSRYLDENDNDNNIPVIRIWNKDILPTITTRSSLSICDKTIIKKQKSKNGTTNIAKN